MVQGFFSLFVVVILLDDLKPALTVGDEALELVHEGTQLGVGLLACVVGALVGFHQGNLGKVLE